MEALKGFFRDQRGMVPYSLLGISMLLIVGVAIYHFNNMDIQKAQERNALTFDMETFYSTVKIGQDLHQVARVSAEKSVLKSSMLTYAEPIDVNEEWRSSEKFEEWKNNLSSDIAKEAEREIYDFYYGGDEEALEKQYYNPSTDFDFSNFISEGDIEVSVTQDRYDASTKTQKSLELNVGFKDGGIVNSTNKFTGYEMSMRTGTDVSVDSRPFTMADKAYDFTNTFNDQEEANQLAWYLWGTQTVLGLMEANVKRDVRFATDDRVSYSLMHLIVAYKELEHFGTFDYVHTTIEFLRPWIGAEGEATEFLSLLSLSMDESYVDQAIASMDAAEFVMEVAGQVQEISNSMILASSYIDSETVTEAGLGFESSEVKKELLSGEGTVQHLKKAEDTKKLTAAYESIMETLKEVKRVNETVTDNTITGLSVAEELSTVNNEYNEVKDEWVEAKKDFTRSNSEIEIARDGYSSLSTYIEGKICENPIAPMLWFGDSNQKVKGFKDILPAKANETDELLGHYDELETKINDQKYDFGVDSYDIKKHYDKSWDELDQSETHLQAAKTAKANYDNWITKKVSCGSYRCTSTELDPINCITGRFESWCYDYTTSIGEKCESSGDDEEEPSCFNYYKDHYYCTCGNYYQGLADDEAEIYSTQMEEAGKRLDGALPEVSDLKTQIDTFFTAKGLADVYPLIENAHGMNYEVTTEPLGRATKPYSISNNYYTHWDYSCSDDEKYECAEKVINPPFIGPINYRTNMPKSPLTYDAAHRDYNDYGLYYIKYMIDMMDETFGGESFDADAIEKGKKKLEDMKEGGFFAKMNAILKPIKELVDTAGDIKSAISKIKNADAEFPNSKEHFYTMLPLPAFDLSGVGIENQGFSVVHDIRLRADTSPGEIKIPIIGTVKLGFDEKTNPSLPIPYTPINVFLWQFEISPSLGPDLSQESSMLWLLDTESSQVAPLMEMEVENEIFDVPLYLHKPTMYKYEFTPDATITKKIGTEHLPPVFILALGPFRTRFGPYMEPPDKEVTDDPIPIDVSFDREFVNNSVEMKVSTTWENILLSVKLTEAASLGSSSLPDSFAIDIPNFDNKGGTREIQAKKLTLLKEYGWSEVRADAYATEISFATLLLNNTKGEDHARVYFIDPELESIEVKLERAGPNLKVINTGNKKVDVSVDPVIENTCTFIFYKGNMSKNWIGSIDPKANVTLNISPEFGTKITAKVLIPEKVKQELESRGIPLKLEDET